MFTTHDLNHGCSLTWLSYGQLAKPTQALNIKIVAGGIDNRSVMLDIPGDDQACAVWRG
jgi:hypothetical protein